MYNWQAIILCGLFAHNTIQILISAIQILQKHNWKVHVNIAGNIFCELLYATPNIHKYQIFTTLYNLQNFTNIYK